MLQVQWLSLFTALVSLAWYIVARRYDQHELAEYILITTGLFLIVPVLMRMNWHLAGRILYFLAFNFGVVATSSHIGQPGGVEIILIFAFGAPFLLFSFIREKAFILVMALVPINGWILLIASDFNLITTSKMDPAIAAKYFYPVSVATTFALVGYQIFYYALVSSKYYRRVHEERQEVEEESDAKSKFLSMMSHEIRTPLNAIIGLSYILQHGSPREDQKHNVDALNYSGNLLLGLLNNILDYSKMDAKEMVLDVTQTDIHQALRQLHSIHEPNCNNKGIQFKSNIQEDIPMVWVDIVRFNQVLNNLINNAVKFTEEGSVTVHVEAKNTTPEKTDLHVEVSDSGIGISEDKIETIFKAFKQEDSSTHRKYGGTGLGLSIVKSIVEQMGGEVKVKSVVGKGSTFFFTITLDRVVGTEEEDPQKEREYNFEGMTTLIVEDNAINEMVGRQILESKGMKVDSAENGKIAVDMVRENHYDVILMDIQMPVMDGYDASIAIREFNEETPIIALSASVLMEVKDRIYHSGMQGFIFKPYSPEELYDGILMTLRQHKRGK